MTREAFQSSPEQNNDPETMQLVTHLKAGGILHQKSASWQANTNNSPLPSILLVLPNERRRQNANFHGRAKLSKTFEDISLFLTTQDSIRFKKINENIWQII